MPTPTSASLIAAAQDRDLANRAAALGATMGIYRGEVESAMPRLAAAPASDSGESIASIYEYAANVRAEKVANLPPAPGLNPGAVTDDHIIYALKKVLGKE